MKSSHGHHGGNQGRTDREEARHQKEAASLNTDVDSLRRSRDEDEAAGHTSGKE